MPTPSEQHRYAVTRPVEKIYQGADAAVDYLVGLYRRRPTVRLKLHRHARGIDRIGAEARTLSDRHLRECLAEFRDDFRAHPDGSDQRLCRALAFIAEAAYRRTGLRPYPVQLMGALALHQGFVAEMATGEGKTLVAALAGVLAGWTHRPCHIVTVNDYLAQRDAEWFAPLYDHCRVSVGFVLSGMAPDARRAGYARDVTYTTGKELLADFLRDRLSIGPNPSRERCHLHACLGGHAPDSAARAGLVMRGLHTAIIDEVDSILIDEAVTPLIISRASPNISLKKACLAALSVANDLRPGHHYKVEARYKEVKLTAAGFAQVAAVGNTMGGLWRAPRRWAELVEQSLTAREFFRKGQQYVMDNGKIVIVDEFTGRMMPQRTWRHGIHQAIEAREGIEISDLSETLSRLSFQRFFRLFDRLAGMTGTAREARRELWRIYRLPVISVPTHRPCVRRLRRDSFHVDMDSKLASVVNTICELHQRGRPVLVGTRSVSASEDLALRLGEIGIPFNLLNAISHREEARIVAEAGEKGRVTIATNMAGRGTDIKLGLQIRELGGLRVIATERHESGRIDRQLFGRCARQGDPGEAMAFLSLDDELMVRFLPGGGRLRHLVRLFLRLRLPGSRLIGIMAVRIAQSVAQRQAFKQRKMVLRMDLWIDEALSFTPSSDSIK